MQKFWENNYEELKEIKEIIFKWSMKLAKYLYKKEKIKIKDKEKSSSENSSKNEIKSSIYCKKKNKL